MNRLVFCDLDGTVATHDGQVRRAVREAMQAVADAGAWITLSTGRHAPDVLAQYHPDVLLPSLESWQNALAAILQSKPAL